MQTPTRFDLTICTPGLVPRSATSGATVAVAVTFAVTVTATLTVTATAIVGGSTSAEGRW